MKTYTKPYTYTKTRSGVIDDHFQLFLTCAGISKECVAKMLTAVEKHELSAVGIYIEDDNHRIAEVSFEVDWDEHKRMISNVGINFDTDLPGWDDGLAPEAYIAAQRLVETAKKLSKPVRSWICVSPSVRCDPNKHKKLCKELGYSFGEHAPTWKDEPISQSRNINYLPEATVIRREIPR